MPRIPRLALAILFLLPCGLATAEPITLLQLRSEFLDRGISPVDVVLVEGHPILSGKILGHGFDAILRDCEGEEKACEGVRFVSCVELPGSTLADAMEFANTYNQGFSEGSAYAQEKIFGPVVCLRKQEKFRDEQKFGMEQIFDWQVALEDFIKTVEDARNARVAANVTGLGAK